MFSLASKLKMLKKPLRKLKFAQRDLAEKVNVLKDRLCKVQEVMGEELFLKQRSKITWLSEGDFNTKFFHNSMKERRNKGRVEYVEDMDGNSFSGPDVKEQFVKHFMNVLGSREMVAPIHEPALLFVNKLSLVDDELMVKHVSLEEIKDVLFSMNDDKAPGPDGYSARFFKAACKIIANRIKGSLNSLVDDYQSAFIPSRQISDNIMLSQELMRNYHRSNGPSKVAFKIDIQKAYDSVDWGFLRQLLMGIIVAILKKILNNSNFKFHWTCEKVSLTDLCFADDLMIFSHGDLNSVKVIKSALDEFSRISGLKPSMEKSMVFFGNVSDHVKAAILGIMPFSVGNSHRGKAKMKWKDVCNLKEQGGLGIKSLHLEHIVTRIGNGKDTSVWFDNWSFLGPLCKFISNMDIFEAGLSLSCKVDDVVCNGEWNWPCCWKTKFEFLVWSDLSIPMPTVPWFKIVWFSQNIPRFAFILWLAINKKLNTQDKFSLKVWKFFKDMMMCGDAPDNLFAFIDYIVSRPIVRLDWRSAQSMEMRGDKVYVEVVVSSSMQQLAAAAVRTARTCIDKEGQTLLDFKAHLQDPIDLLSTWRPEEEADCCQWFGVTCNNQTGHVTMLDLSSYFNSSGLEVKYIPFSLAWNEFTGSIPESIGYMTQLTHLDVHGNNFSGTIPRSIGSLTQLTYLNLDGNNFSGTIPISIASLTRLTYLNLYVNNFSGTIPISIASLTQLTYLNLGGNQFTGTIPRSIGSLTNLTELRLGGNNFTGSIPDSIGSLTNLTELRLNENNFIGIIPRSIGHKLAVLSLWQKFDDETFYNFMNNLSGCTSATLQELDASSNQFRGSFSDGIQNFSSLFRLNLSSNELDGTISDKLWQLPNIQILDLSSNSFRGDISKNIGKSSLVYIDLSYNSLEGALSNDDVSNLSQSIVYINFSSNKLGPRFPKWIQKLKNLTYLDLSKNSISDTVSTTDWNQWESSQLTYLDLSFNNISGTLPKSLSFCDLDLIDLSFNSFCGTIPAFPARVRFVDLSKNKFHGGVSFLCQVYVNLEFLDLSRNSLTGKLPNCSGKLSQLKVLNLGHNTLSGSIPPSVGCLGQLETLSVYNNSLSGELPLSLKNCTMLSLLDLGANSLYGNIPVWIGKDLSRLYALSLKSNNFFGTIPSQICRLVSLQILDLSYNNLNGTIPSCVTNLTSMVQKGLFYDQNVHHYLSSVNFKTINYYYSRDSDENSYTDNLMIKWQGKINEFSSTLGLVKTIDLSSNNLTGQIPTEVTNLYGLLVLDLSNNSLVGEIPRNIGQMRKLLTLNLSRNMLSGEMPSSMSDMHSLNDLDVSFNNLSRRIPSSTQLQSFEPARFTGNAGLCGLPTTKKCIGDEDLGVPHVVKSESDGYSFDELQRWFNVGAATGFATGFWIVVSALLFNRRGRRAFFHFHDSVKDWGYVKVMVFIAKWQRVAHA
ncbi:leucine-rich repeat-containing protein [Tanacetum coccineum]